MGYWHAAAFCRCVPPLAALLLTRADVKHCNSNMLQSAGGSGFGQQCWGPGSWPAALERRFVCCDVAHDGSKTVTCCLKQLPAGLIKIIAPTDVL